MGKINILKKKSGHIAFFPKDADKECLLHVLAASNDLKGIQLVLSTLKTEEERVEALGMATREGLTPLMSAHLHESNATIQWLEKKGLTVEGGSMFLFAIGKYRHAMGRRILDKSTSEERKQLFEKANKDGQTALMLASRSNFRETFKKECLEVSPFSPQFFFVAFLFLSCVAQLLLSYEECDVWHRDKGGFTAFHRASMNDKVEAMEILFQAMVKTQPEKEILNHHSNNRMTCLTLAGLNNAVAATKVLPPPPSLSALSTCKC